MFGSRIHVPRTSGLTLILYQPFIDNHSFYLNNHLFCTNLSILVWKEVERNLFNYFIVLDSMNYQEYQEPTVMNFLKTTVSKARSSAANTNRKNDSQFDHMDYDDINQNLFTTF